MASNFITSAMLMDGYVSPHLHVEVDSKMQSIMVLPIDIEFRLQLRKKRKATRHDYLQVGDAVSQS